MDKKPETREELDKMFREMTPMEIARSKEYQELQWEIALNAPMTPERKASMKEFEDYLENYEIPPQSEDFKLEVKCDEVYTEEEVQEVLDDIGYAPHPPIGQTIRIEKVYNDDGFVIQEIHHKEIKNNGNN